MMNNTKISQKKILSFWYSITNLLQRLIKWFSGCKDNTGWKELDWVEYQTGKKSIKKFVFSPM